MSLSSRGEQDIHFPQAGDLIKQLFFLGKCRGGDFSCPQGWIWCCPTPWTPEEPRCPWAELPARGDSGALWAPLWDISAPFPISSPAVPLAMSFPPFCSWFWLSWLCQTPHPWSLLPTPGCQGLVLCQCQGGEHEAPAHSEPPLHSCLLWGAEGQQIITPCCSSLMCVFISCNYVAIPGYLFILKLQQWH